jgi:dTDP-6-deoxy-L-talose 4-dehydrogenase (NAD+)
MKKILVTGATGFIGNYVVSILADQHEVIATGAHESKARNRSWYQQVQFIPFNLADYDAATDYFNYFQEPEHVIHLAWEGLPNYQAAFHVDTNLPRHYQFLYNLVKNGAKDLTITGTCLEYGMQEGALTETMPVFPGNPYAIAKNSLRNSLEELQQHYSFSMKWLRLFYLYGPGQHPQSLVSQLDAAIKSGQETFDMSGGEQVRDFLPVEKGAEYIVKTALQADITGIINCSSNKPVTVKKFVEEYLFNHAAPMKLNTGVYPYPTYEPMRFWGDNAKLKRILQ